MGDSVTIRALPASFLRRQYVKTWGLLCSRTLASRVGGGRFGGGGFQRADQDRLGAFELAVGHFSFFMQPPQVAQRETLTGSGVIGVHPLAVEHDAPEQQQQGHDQHNRPDQSAAGPLIALLREHEWNGRHAGRHAIEAEAGGSISD